MSSKALFFFLATTYTTLSATTLQDFRQALSDCFLEAASAGNLQRVQALSFQADINSKDHNGCTALHKASANNRISVVEFLVNCPHIDVNLREKNELHSPLMIAYVKGHEKIMQLLLEKKANVNFLNYKGYSILHLTSAKGYFSILKLLLSYPGANPNLKDQYYDKIPLMYAILEGDYQIIDLWLTQKMINLNITTKKGITSLILACQCRDPKAIRKLLAAKKNLNINQRDHMGRTALFHAVRMQASKVVEALLTDPTIDIDQPNKKGCTPLMVCIRNGDLITLELLLDHKKINMLAREHYNHDIFHCLLSKGLAYLYDPFFRRGKVYVTKVIEPLFWKSYEKHPLTFQKGSFVFETEEATDRYQKCMTLVSAMRCGNQGLVERFLKQESFDLNLYDRRGNSVLIYASQRGKNSLVNQLISNPMLDVGMEQHYTIAYKWATKHKDLLVMMRLLIVENLPNDALTINMSNNKTALEAGFLLIYLFSKENWLKEWSIQPIVWPLLNYLVGPLKRRRPPK